MKWKLIIIKTKIALRLTLIERLRKTRKWFVAKLCTCVWGVDNQHKKILSNLWHPVKLLRESRGPGKLRKTKANKDWIHKPFLTNSRLTTKHLRKTPAMFHLTTSMAVSIDKTKPNTINVFAFDNAKLTKYFCFASLFFFFFCLFWGGSSTLALSFFVFLFTKVTSSKSLLANFPCIDKGMFTFPSITEYHECCSERFDKPIWHFKEKILLQLYHSRGFKIKIAICWRRMLTNRWP